MTVLYLGIMTQCDDVAVNWPQRLALTYRTCFFSYIVSPH